MSNFREGDVVNYHSVIGGPHDGIAHVVETISDLSGRAVAWITKKRGCVALDALSLAHCPSCGYTSRDASLHLDHHLCKNVGFFPSESQKGSRE